MIKRVVNVEEILELRKSGLSGLEISTKLNIPKSTVYYMIGPTRNIKYNRDTLINKISKKSTIEKVKKNAPESKISNTNSSKTKYKLPPSPEKTKSPKKKSISKNKKSPSRSRSNKPTEQDKYGRSSGKLSYTEEELDEFEPEGSAKNSPRLRRSGFAYRKSVPDNSETQFDIHPLYAREI